VEAAHDLCRHYDFASGLKASAKNIHFLFSGPFFILYGNGVAFLQPDGKTEIQLRGKPMLINRANAQEICISGKMQGSVADGPIRLRPGNF
jgi:hypothetical protein